MSPDFEGKVGPSIESEGSVVFLRFDKQRGLVTTDSHGRYYEQASRRTLFSCNTALAGTTVVAGNVSPVAAATATILSLYNPLDSGINLEVLKAILTMISGTPGAGLWAYNQAFGQNITAVQNATPTPLYASGAISKAKGFTQTALTGGVGAQSIGRFYPANAFAAAIAATSFLNFPDLPDGDIVVPPGGLLSIAAPATGTTLVVGAGLVFAEVPIPTP